MLSREHGFSSATQCRLWTPSDRSMGISCFGARTRVAGVAVGATERYRDIAIGFDDVDERQLFRVGAGRY